MKIFKHLFTALLLLCATAATAHDFEVDGIFYNVLSTTDRTVSVTYKGNSNSEYSNEYLGAVIIPASVTYGGAIYSGTSIGSWAFYNCSGLTSIVIPGSVTSIGDDAFYGCNNLKVVVNLSDLTFTRGSTSNGYVAYYADVNRVYNAPKGRIEGDFVLGKPNDVKTLVGYLGSAKTATLPADYDGENYVIGSDAFYNRDNLTSVEIPGSVTGIGSSAFYDC